MKGLCATLAVTLINVTCFYTDDAGCILLWPDGKFLADDAG